MIKTLFILFSLFSTCYSKLINLNGHNSIIVRIGPVTGSSVSKWITQLNKIDEEKIYIYITSPGGSVYHGNLFIEQIKSLEQNGKNRMHC